MCHFDRRTHSPTVRSQRRNLHLAPAAAPPKDKCVISTEERTATVHSQWRTCVSPRPQLRPPKTNVSFRPKNAQSHRAFAVEKPASRPGLQESSQPSHAAVPSSGPTPPPKNKCVISTKERTAPPCVRSGETCVSPRPPRVLAPRFTRPQLRPPNKCVISTEGRTSLTVRSQRRNLRLAPPSKSPHSPPHAAAPPPPPTPPQKNKSVISTEERTAPPCVRSGETCISSPPIPPLRAAPPSSADTPAPAAPASR